MRMRKFAFVMALLMTITCGAKDIKNVIFTMNPQLKCANCENRIKSNLRFEKGVKDILTDIDSNTVTVKFDADKTTVENLIAGFGKINYQATVVKSKEEAKCKKNETCNNGDACKKGDACGKKDDCCKK